jgi:hypothetical protein
MNRRDAMKLLGVGVAATADGTLTTADADTAQMLRAMTAPFDKKLAAAIGRLSK